MNKGTIWHHDWSDIEGGSGLNLPKTFYNQLPENIISNKNEIEFETVPFSFCRIFDDFPATVFWYTMGNKTAFIWDAKGEND